MEENGDQPMEHEQEVRNGATAEEKRRPRLVAISGSLRVRSSNTAILRAIWRLAEVHADIWIYDGLGGLPHFNPDDDGGELGPEPVERLRTLLREADGVLVCTPEYANGVPGSLKNALDWLVSSASLYGKPVAAISASPNPLGGDKAMASLLLTLGMMTASVAEGGTLSIPFVSKKLDATGELVDPETERALTRVLATLIGQTLTQQAE